MSQRFTLTGLPPARAGNLGYERASFDDAVRASLAEQSRRLVVDD